MLTDENRFQFQPVTGIQWNTMTEDAKQQEVSKLAGDTGIRALKAICTMVSTDKHLAITDGLLTIWKEGLQ